MSASARVTEFPVVAAKQDDPKETSRRQRKHSRNPHFLYSMLCRKACRKLSSACSKMLSRLSMRHERLLSMFCYAPETCDGTGRDIFYGMDERRAVRQVLLICVNPTLELSFGNQIDPDVNGAISLAKVRIERKKNRPLKLCYTLGKMHNTSNTSVCKISLK